MKFACAWKDVPIKHYFLFLIFLYWILILVLDPELCVLKNISVSQVAQPADEPAAAGEAPDEPMEHWGSPCHSAGQPMIYFLSSVGGGHKPRPTWHLLQLNRAIFRGERCCCDVPLVKLLIQNILLTSINVMLLLYE